MQHTAGAQRRMGRARRQKNNTGEKTEKKQGQRKGGKKEGEQQVLKAGSEGEEEGQHKEMRQRQSMFKGKLRLYCQQEFDLRAIQGPKLVNNNTGKAVLH